ncbi:MAG: hypothetical protein ACI9CZ_001534, partial [Flavobacterium sp.]
QFVFTAMPLGAALFCSALKRSIIIYLNKVRQSKADRVN